MSEYNVDEILRNSTVKNSFIQRNWKAWNAVKDDSPSWIWDDEQPPVVKNLEPVPDPRICAKTGIEKQVCHCMVCQLLRAWK